MDSLTRRAGKRAHAVLVFLSLQASCQTKELAPSPPLPHPPVEPVASTSSRALQIPPEQLSRIELVTRQDPSPGRRIVLAKVNGTWQVVAPVKYPANQVAVESMVAVMAEIEILTSRQGDEREVRRHSVDEATGVQVKAWAGDARQIQFIVGRSLQESTYVRLVGDDRILTVRGRCRPIFDKPLNDLRDPIMTNVAPKEIESVRYQNAFGVLELVADDEESGKFVPKGAPIPNFNRDRAAQQVGVLARLLARGFVDTPSIPDTTGLFDPATARATLSLRGPEGVRTLDVWVGTRTRAGLHVRTSETNQIYLVSGHLDTSLVARRSHLERSDELMRQLRARQEKLAAIEKARGTHAHPHSPSPASQVSAENLSALRELARQQTEGR